MLTSNPKHVFKLVSTAINNLFDKDPPRGDSTNTGAFGGGNGNTFPQTYDTLGRNIFVGLTADF